MKKRLFALLSCAALAAASITGCSSQKPAESAAASAEAESTTGAPSKEVGDYKIALITMDSIDQHWVTLNEGAQAEAKALGVTVSFMSPNTKDDAQQIECVNNAVAGGYQAIIVAANGPDAISSALKEAKDAGIKIVYVDSPANVEAEATFSTDNEAAGETAGKEMLKALEESGITSGKIGIVNVNAATDSTVKHKGGLHGADPKGTRSGQLQDRAQSCFNLRVPPNGNRHPQRPRTSLRGSLDVFVSPRNVFAAKSKCRTESGTKGSPHEARQRCKSQPL